MLNSNFLFPEFCGHDVHRIAGGPIVDRDNFFEKSRSKCTKDEKRDFEMVYQHRKSGHLADQVDHSD